MTFITRLLAPVDRLISALTDPARRERVIVPVLVAYVLLWTLYGVLAKASQDIHPDVSELVVWARELALGYPKHPPLAAWVMAAWTTVFPVTDWSMYLLGMTTAGVALWCVWRIAGDYLDPPKRVFAVALLTLVPFFNFHALKFNPNSILLPLWAATALCFLRSFERRSPGWAALAGFWAAAAMLGKFWSIFLLAGLGLAALSDVRRAKYFASSAPWITIAVGLLVLSPYIVWLVMHDFAPLHYATYVHGGSEASAWRTVPGYILGSMALVALPLVLALATMRPSRAAALDTIRPADASRRLVAVAFWTPLLLPALVAPLLGVHVASLWSIPAWALFPIVLLSSPLVSLQREPMLTVGAIALALPPALVVAAPFIADAIHRSNGDPSGSHYRLVAERAAHEWRRVTDRPLRLVSGDGDFAEGAAFYLPGRVSAFPDARLNMAPWISQDRLRRDGAAIICRPGDRACLDRPAQYGLTGPRIDVEIARTYHGVAGPKARYIIVIAPPRG